MSRQARAAKLFRRFNSRLRAATDQSVAFDFRSGALDPRFSFTRASAASSFDASGSFVQAASNVPRFDYNPTTLEARGLMLEEARTNLLLNSAAPGTQNVTVTAVTHILSFYGTGSITLSGAATGTLNSAGAFPARAVLSFTPTAGTLTLTVSGSVTNANLEAGAFATSWILTTGATATRANESAIMATVTPWFNANQGTMLAEFEYPVFPTFGGSIVAQEFYRLDDGTANNVLAMRTVRDGVASVYCDTLGLGFDGPNNSFSAGQICKMALAYSSAGYATSFNGGAVTSAAAATPTGINRALFSGAGAAVNLRKIRYFPMRLTNAELQGITA